MKTVILLFIASGLLCIVAAAQNKEYVLKENNDANKEIPAAERFKYQSFAAGHVVLRDGNVATVPLNYNHIVGDVQFINASGDTLSIANEALVKYITISNDTFYYDKAYLQLIDGGGGVKLAKNEKVKISNIKKPGPYDVASSSSSAVTYSSVNVSGKTEELTAMQEVTLQTTTTYYIGDNSYHFLPANKKNILKLFAKKQNEISVYLQSNKVNFNSKDDLEKLVSFLRTLTM